MEIFPYPDGFWQSLRQYVNGLDRSQISQQCRLNPSHDDIPMQLTHHPCLHGSANRKYRMDDKPGMSNRENTIERHRARELFPAKKGAETVAEASRSLACQDSLKLRSICLTLSHIRLLEAMNRTEMSGYQSTEVDSDVCENTKSCTRGLKNV
jgi:hypothetical protein